MSWPRSRSRNGCSDQRLELRDEFDVAAGGEVGVDPVLGGGEPQFLQTGDGGVREGLPRELGQGRTAPQAECIAQFGGRAARVTPGQQPAPVADGGFEPLGIDGARRWLQRVPGRLGGEQVTAAR